MAQITLQHIISRFSTEHWQVNNLSD